MLIVTYILQIFSLSAVTSKYTIYRYYYYTHVHADECTHAHSHFHYQANSHMSFLYQNINERQDKSWLWHSPVLMLFSPVLAVRGWSYNLRRKNIIHDTPLPALTLHFPASEKKKTLLNEVPLCWLANTLQCELPCYWLQLSQYHYHMIFPWSLMRLDVQLYASSYFCPLPQPLPMPTASSTYWLPVFLVLPRGQWPGTFTPIALPQYCTILPPLHVPKPLQSTYSQHCTQLLHPHLATSSLHLSMRSQPYTSKFSDHSQPPHHPTSL